MSENLNFRVIAKSDLLSGQCYAGLEDSEQIASMSDEKRTAVLTNPLSHDGAEPVQILAVNDGRVVGRMDLIKGEVVKWGEIHPIYWLSGFVVPAQYAGTGAGPFLILYAQSIHHTLGHCGASRLAAPLYQKLRWTDFEMSRWILPLSTRPLYERYVPGYIPTRPLVNASNYALLLRNTLRRRIFGGRKLGVESQKVDRMGEELDSKLVAHSLARLSCHRSVRWVNWLLENKFSNSPTRTQELHYVYDNNGEIVGYFLIRAQRVSLLSKYNLPGVVLGSLMDWCIFDDQYLDNASLIYLAICELLKQNLDAIEVCVPEDQDGAYLKKLGFLRLGSLHFMFRASSKSRLSDRRFHQRNLWRITPAEADNFFFYG